MTPESLVGFIPSVLTEIAPPKLAGAPGDAFGISRWLNRYRPESGTYVPHGIDNPLWPSAPRISPTDYALGTFSGPPIFYLSDSIPVSFCNFPGANVRGEFLPALSECEHVYGHVIASNGEVIFSRTDFELPGPFRFSWQRFYRQSADNSCRLGTGWRHTLSEHLLLPETGDSSQTVTLNTAEGRNITFNLPAIGHGSFNRSERLCLIRQSLHSFRISGFEQPDRIFRADGAGRSVPLSEIRDTFGNTLTIDYQDGQPCRVVTSWGRTLEITYRDGLLWKITNTSGSTDVAPLCSYQYNEEHQLYVAENNATVTGADMSGRTKETYGYEEGRLSKVHGGKAGQLLFSYDRIDRCNRLSVNQQSYRLHWSSGRRMCTLSGDDQYDIQWQFDTRGNLISRRQHDRETRRRYDHYRNLCLQTDSGGIDTVFRHDEFGRPVRRTRNGVHQHYIYDTQGRLLAAGVASSEGPTAVWKFGYAEHALATEITDPAGNQWLCDFDEKGQLRQLKDPEQGCVTLHWDAQSQLRELQRGDRKYHWQYDNWGRLTEHGGTGVPPRTWKYEDTGALSSTIRGAHSYIIRYDDTHYPCAIDCDGETQLQWQYDDRRLARHIQFAGSAPWDLHYNASGQLTELHTGDTGLSWRYDGFGQLIAFSGDGEYQQREWQYDHSGRVAEYRDSDNHWYLEYARNGDLDQIRNNNGQHCSFHFDIQGRLVQAENNSCSLRYRYDSRNLLIAEHRDLHTDNRSESLSINHQYDGRGWLRSSGSDSINIAYTFAACGSLYGIDVNGMMVLRCEYREDREILSLGNHVVEKHYAKGQLQQVQLGTELLWQGDVDNGILPEPQQLLVRTANIDTQLDLRGNIVSEVRRIQGDQLGYHYQFDGWGLLHSAECGDFKTYFHYDPFGRRVAKTSTHRRSRRQQRVFSHWSGLGLWSETTSRDDSRSTSHYLHQPGNTLLVARALQNSDSDASTEIDSTQLTYYVTEDRGQLLALLGNDGAEINPGNDEGINGERSGESSSDQTTPLWQRDTTGSPNVRGPGTYRGSEGIYDVETQLIYRNFCYWHPDGSKTHTAPLDIGQGRLMMLRRSPETVIGSPELS